jgi:hypothetical protein
VESLDLGVGPDKDCANAKAVCRSRLVTIVLPLWAIDPACPFPSRAGSRVRLALWGVACREVGWAFRGKGLALFHACGIRWMVEAFWMLSVGDVTPTYSGRLWDGCPLGM